MKYSPLAQIKQSKISSIYYTNGKELMYANGDEYIGQYYILDDVYYVGCTYQDDAIKLYTYSNNLDYITYCNLKNRIYIVKNNLIPKQYIPVITSKDIENGKIYRHFIRQRNDEHSAVTEIDEGQYNSWIKKGSGINENFYVAIRIEWQITGKLESSYHNGLIIDGIIDFNRKQVEEQKVLDLSNIITSYAEYAYPT